MTNGQNNDGNQNAQAMGDGASASVTINNSYHATPARTVDAATLSAAKALLDTMPEDVVPDPASTPPLVFGDLPLHNRLFVGREDELKALACRLKHGGAAAVGQSPALSGWGGVGKSQLATEFAWHYGRFFQGGVFWLSVADAASIPTEIAGCGKSMGLHTDFTGFPLDTQVALVGAAWRDGLPRLLIFDNCEDEAIFRQWCPKAGDCRVLLTTRRERWSPDLGVAVKRLDTLPRSESIALLCRHRPSLDPTDPALDAICEDLGDLPLAIHVAGSSLARYEHDSFGQPAAYLAALRAQGVLDHHSLAPPDAPDENTPTRHDAHVARTFALSYDRLDPSDPTDALARRALVHAARLAPGEPIPRGLLALCLETDPEDDDAARHLSDALRRLSDLGLIEGRDGTVTLHRLIAAFARRRDSDAEGTAHRVWTTVYKAAFEQNETGLPGPLLAWQTHLRHAAMEAETAGAEVAGALWNATGFHLRMIGDLNGAREAYTRALDIGKKAFGPDHPTVASAVNNLGGVLHDQGDLDDARKAFTRALRIWETTRGPDHPTVASAVNNLGSVLHDQGDLDGAREAFTRALGIDEKTFGPDHPKVAIRVNNLGSVLQDQGDRNGARDAYTRALGIDEEAFGPNHPSVARDVNNLGSVLRDQGDLSGARAAYTRALSIFETTLGPEHPNTQTVRRHLSSLS